MEDMFVKPSEKRFRHYLFEPYILLAMSYETKQNYYESISSAKKALECVPSDFHHLEFFLTEQIQLAKNYLNCVNDCVQKSMVVCQQSMGVEKKLFHRLFPMFTEPTVCNIHFLK